MKNDQPKPLYKYKRPTAYVLILLVVLLGHQYFMQLPIESFRYIRHSILSMLCLITFFGAYMIVKQKKLERSDMLFIFIMITVGLTNSISLIKGYTTGYAGVVQYKFMSAPMLFYGIFYSYIFLLYPLEAFRPGWLTFKRALLLLLPALIFLILYIVDTKMHTNAQPGFDNWTSFILESHWFTVFTRLLILVYPIIGIVIMLRYRKGYNEWCENNFASMENIDIKWLGDYIFANLIITISCQIIVFSNDVRSVLMHNIIFLAFLLYAFYRVLFWKSPYPKDYFKEGMNEREAQLKEDRQTIEDLINIDGIITIDDLNTEDNTIHISEKDTIINKTLTDINRSFTDINRSFTDRIPHYKEKLEEWMEAEKPYLRKDFKLIDAIEILPLNRSYLSRLFNEGYGESFYHFVMRYRLEESKRLLLTCPHLKITEIAELSGFSSISVFGRAFSQNMDCSPIQWREKNIM